MDFCHLHVHDQYSILDGFGTSEMYVSEAKKHNFKYIASTNHGNIDGLIKFQKCCEANDITPILGSELYVVDNLTIKDNKEKRGHIVVLVKNAIGWNNLTKMLTIANLDGFYKKPRVDFNTILQYYEGLIFLTACTSSFIYNEKGIGFLENLLKKTKNVYCEIMPIDFVNQQAHNKNILKIAKKYNLDVIASNDCHYPRSENAEAQEVLLAIQRKAKWDDPKRWKFDSVDLYLKSAKEMIESFKKNHPYINETTYISAIENTVKVAKQCHYKLESENVFLPLIIEEKHEFEYLLQLCQNGLEDKIIAKKIPSAQYRKRMTYELSIIKQQKFVSYFLIIQDVVNWCKQNNIFVGPCRGSVGSSLIAFLIGITEVDPIKHNLMFERFISPNRVDPPDIDLDFEDRKKREVRNYFEQKYGKNNTASVSTFLVMRTKMVFRDVCRVFNVPIDKVNAVSSFIDYSVSEQIDTVNFDKIFNSVPQCIEFKNKYPKIVNYCSQLEGQIRGIGKHAAAIILAKEDLRISNRCNLTRRNEVLTVNWDKKDAKFMGMLKIDILGLSNLSIMSYCKELIKQNHNIEINFEEIDLEDNLVLREFARGNCIGIFQFNTYGLSKLCKELRVNNFDLLMHIVAMHRPAALRSGMVEEFKTNYFRKEKNVHGNKLDKILYDTYGIIIYQEQVIRIIVELAQMSFINADRIRKLLDHEDKESLEQYRYPFIQGCIKNDIDRLDAIKIWKNLISYGGYGFCQAHACGYTILSFMNQWAKVYYPAEFMCASLTFSPLDKKQELINEAYRIGLKVIPPKVGISHATLWTLKGKTVYTPFIEVKGVGEKYAEQMMKIKNRGFFEQEQKGRVNAILNKINAYDETNTSNNELLPWIFPILRRD